MCSASDSLGKYFKDPRVIRFCEYCRKNFEDPADCYATYNKIEFFYHSLGLVRRTGDTDLRKLRAMGLVYSKRFKFSGKYFTVEGNRSVVFFYPTDKLVEICRKYAEGRAKGTEEELETEAYRALYGTARRGEGQ